MSSPTELRFSARLNYGYELNPHARILNAVEDHARTIPLVGALTQSIYELAGELNGMGPIAHTLLRQGETSLRQRVDGVLTSINELRSDLSKARASYVQRQLEMLGVTEQSRDLQLHIGCGGHHLQGWINIDNYPAPLAIDLNWGLPFVAGSVRFVYLAHLLEHLFYPKQTHWLLDEIHRVLAPGGIVRIVVPDIEQCLRAYVDDNEPYFSARREHWTSIPDDATRLEHFLNYAGAGPDPAMLFEHHKFGFDFETLRRCLERCGFIHVRRCDFQKSPHEALRVDHASANATAQHANGYFSLFVEAEVS
jgi:predicted SAM-dependent methyltransferase